jgi:hypothetical protein
MDVADGVQRQGLVRVAAGVSGVAAAVLVRSREAINTQGSPLPVPIAGGPRRAYGALLAPGASESGPDAIRALPGGARPAPVFAGPEAPPNRFGGASPFLALHGVKAARPGEAVTGQVAEIA